MKKLSIFTTFALTALLAGCSGQAEPKTVAAGAACSQLPGDDQILAQFYESGGVYDAQPVKEKFFRARAAQPERTVGASLHVRAEEGMNSPYVRRVLACHASHGEEAHPNDPLHPSSGTIASLTVSESKHGFRVDVVADNLKAGEEVWQRASALKNQGGAVTVEQVGALTPTKSADL